MQVSKGPIVIGTSLLLVIVMSAIFTRGGAPKQQNEGPDFSNFPIVDLNEKPQTDLKVKARRDNKSRKYSQKYGKVIDETSETIATSSDWDLRLPALPVQRSAAIVIGAVSRAEANLSLDRKAVYSDFAVKVDSILKEDPKKPLAIGDTISIERSGGRVRMPSGKIMVAWTSNQEMPKVGSRYVFFLTHDFQAFGDTYDDFYLLTAYELREGKVFPLDKSPSQRTYADVAESHFLTDLVEALKTPTAF